MLDLFNLKKHFETHNNCIVDRKYGLCTNYSFTFVESWVIETILIIIICVFEKKCIFSSFWVHSSILLHQTKLANWVIWIFSIPIIPERFLCVWAWTTRLYNSAVIVYMELCSQIGCIIINCGIFQNQIPVTCPHSNWMSLQLRPRKLHFSVGWFFLRANICHLFFPFF